MGLAHQDRVIDINIRGVVHRVAAAYPRMVAQGAGHIVNVASLVGVRAGPDAGPLRHVQTRGGRPFDQFPHRSCRPRFSVLCPAAIETPLLDETNPKGLPPVPSRPDVRRFPTRLPGKPHPVDAMVHVAVTGIERNKRILVIPREARVLWRVGRVAPRLVEKACRNAAAGERKARGRQGK